MRRNFCKYCLAVLYSVGFLCAQDTWRVHDRNRPNPEVVTPGKTSTEAPSDAIPLFDGHNLDQFESQNGGAAPWQVADGYFVVKPESGSIQTKRAFGDCQLHVEWASPNPPQGTDQMRGNSGVIIMGLYELQVLDSYNAKTYADGQAGAIYGQYPPLVNATRPPGEWQTYDVIFRQPRFDTTGHLVSRARETVLLNGVLVQDATPLSGPTAYHNRPPYLPLPERLPLVLQDHGTPVRYRNIWIRDLPPAPEPLPLSAFIPLKPDAKIYAEYVGEYQSPEHSASVALSGDKLTLTSKRHEGGGEVNAELELIPISDDAFTGRGRPGADLVRIEFARGAGEKVESLTMFLGGHYISMAKK